MAIRGWRRSYVPHLLDPAIRGWRRSCVRRWRSRAFSNVHIARPPGKRQPLDALRQVQAAFCAGPDDGNPQWSTRGWPGDALGAGCPTRRRKASRRLGNLGQLRETPSDFVNTRAVTSARLRYAEIPALWCSGGAKHRWPRQSFAVRRSIRRAGTIHAEVAARRLGAHARRRATGRSSPVSAPLELSNNPNFGEGVHKPRDSHRFPSAATVPNTHTLATCARQSGRGRQHKRCEFRADSARRRGCRHGGHRITLSLPSSAEWRRLRIRVFVALRA